MYGQQTVTVILPTYNEKDSIRQVIQEFERHRHQLTRFS